MHVQWFEATDEVSLQEGQPQDPDARAAWPWWKTKKWVLHITYRLFNRYGDPKASRSGADGDFIRLFSQQCSLKLLEAHMKLMAAYSQVNSLCMSTLYLGEMLQRCCKQCLEAVHPVWYQLRLDMLQSPVEHRHGVQ